MHGRSSIDRGASGKCIPRHNCYIVGGAAELIRGDLSQRGFVRLTLRRRTGVDPDLATGRDAHYRAFIGAETGRFHRIADTESDVAALLLLLPLNRTCSSGLCARR
jgi:hypothetical protein